MCLSPYMKTNIYFEIILLWIEFKIPSRIPWKTTVKHFLNNSNILYPLHLNNVLLSAVCTANTCVHLSAKPQKFFACCELLSRLLSFFLLFLRIYFFIANSNPGLCNLVISITFKLPVCSYCLYSQIENLNNHRAK